MQELSRAIKEAIHTQEFHAMEGNHEKHIADTIDSKLGASGLRQTDTLEGEGVMDIPELLALDSIDCEYHAPYGKPFWLYDQIKNLTARSFAKVEAQLLKRCSRLLRRR